VGVLASLITAFLGGLLSFASPCVLPLVPAYLSFLTGMTTTELAGGSRRISVLAPALLFVAGFSAVFVAMGASASVLGHLLVQYRPILERAAGLLVVAFGVVLLGVIKAPWLYGELRTDLSRSRGLGRASAFVMGAAFAAGWTPCVGPILGAILTMAGSSGTVGRGALLLMAYSAGLGVPFMLVALLFGRARPLLAFLARHSLTVNRVAGSVMIIVGVLMLTGLFGVVAGWLTSAIPALPTPQVLQGLRP
jgi:cytochrome c-type biogenesis protein